MSILTLDLSRIMYDLEEEDVMTVILEDYPNLRLDGINLRLIKGQEVSLPLWIAEILEEEQILSIKMDEVISPRVIKQLVHLENDNRSLNSIDSLLYRRVRKYIAELRNKSTSSTLRKLTSVEGSFDTLLRLRFRKIMQYALGGKLDHRGRNTLSAEEKWLYENLFELFSTYRTSSGMESGGD